VGVALDLLGNRRPPLHGKRWTKMWGPRESGFAIYTTWALHLLKISTTTRHRCPVWQFQSGKWELEKISLHCSIRIWMYERIIFHQFLTYSYSWRLEDDELVKNVSLTISTSFLRLSSSSFLAFLTAAAVDLFPSISDVFWPPGPSTMLMTVLPAASFYWHHHYHTY